MRKKRKIILGILFLTLIGGIGVGAFAWNRYRGKQRFLIWKYDLTHTQRPVITKVKLDSILDGFEKVPFSKLDKEWVEFTKCSDAKYRKLVGKPTFFRVKGEDMFKYIVGKHRICDFLPNDKYYKSHLADLEGSAGVYWLMDSRVLHRFIELRRALEKAGHDPDAFRVYNGYRHPQYNEKIKAAKQSRHMKGEAIDVSIRDINRDGRATQKDKEIVLKLLNEKIIRKTGGIGRYPGTMSVHFDVRGWGARWDSY